MAATFTPRTSSGRRSGSRAASTSPSASTTPSRQDDRASWASSPAFRASSGRVTRLRASTRPSPSAATAFTEVVPMSMPTVTSLAIPTPDRLTLASVGMYRLRRPDCLGAVDGRTVA